MIPEDVESFVRFVRQQASETLRLVIIFSENDYSTPYARDDLQEGYSVDDIDEVVGKSRRVTQLQSPSAASDATGEIQCHVVCYEDVVSVIFPKHQGRGIMLSLDAAAAAQLHQFATNCREFLSNL